MAKAAVVVKTPPRARKNARGGVRKTARAGRRSNVLSPAELEKRQKERWYHRAVYSKGGKFLRFVKTPLNEHPLAGGKGFDAAGFRNAVLECCGGVKLDIPPRR